jgi:bacteriorhodopsin
MRAMALLRRFAIVLGAMVVCVAIGALVLLKLQAPDWSFYALGIAATAIVVARTMASHVAGRTPDGRWRY